MMNGNMIGQIRVEETLWIDTLQKASKCYSISNNTSNYESQIKIRGKYCIVSVCG